MFAKISIQDFLSQVASPDPVPAGGGIAALNAASAAALIEMVARLTIDRKGYEAVWDRMREMAQECACLRAALLADIDRDAAAYRAVIAAYRLPKATPVERESRAGAIQEALRQATSVPFEVAQRALRLINLAGEAISKGNPHAAADGAAGMLSARAALLTAVGNIRTNVISIRDSSWVDRMQSETERMEKEACSHAFCGIVGIRDA
jgi:formiminotetrahydrofolate cyclodeaminase